VVGPVSGAGDTYTFELQTTNYIPSMGKFEITFPFNSWTGLENCDIISGLPGGYCVVINAASGNSIIQFREFYTTYIPD
jgi:hypothetical protein